MVRLWVSTSYGVNTCMSISIYRYDPKFPISHATLKQVSKGHLRSELVHIDSASAASRVSDATVA